MVTITWVEIVAMLVAPTLLLFLATGVITILKHAKAWLITEKMRK